MYYKNLIFSRLKENGVDILICDGLYPALPLDREHDYLTILCYTIVWNYLNCPVGIMPITNVKKDE